jgi:hypothetical protein
MLHPENINIESGVRLLLQLQLLVNVSMELNRIKGFDGCH